MGKTKNDLSKLYLSKFSDDGHENVFHFVFVTQENIMMPDLYNTRICNEITGVSRNDQLLQMIYKGKTFCQTLQKQTSYKDFF